MKKTGIIIVVVLAALLVWGVSIRNTMVTKDAVVEKSWADVQNVYQSRLELIPNLVAVVKGNAAFESSTLEEIAAARSKAAAVTVATVSGQASEQQLTAQNEMAAAVNRLLIQVEKYPDLKGTKAFSGLQAQLEGIERRVKFVRKDFNAAVADYNIYVKRFPNNLFAGVFGFSAKSGFAADAGSENAVEIKF